MRRKLLAINLILVMLVSLFAFIPSIEVQADDKVTIILLGDSRVAGMGLTLFGLSNSKNSNHGTNMDSCYGRATTSGYSHIFAVGLGGWSIGSSGNGKTSKAIYQDGNFCNTHLRKPAERIT